MIVHAEMNAILNARQSVRGLTLYINPLSPCPECAKLIAASGIDRVVWTRAATSSLEDLELVKLIFERNAIFYTEVSVPPGMES